jgi:hypothetical protein
MRQADAEQGFAIDQHQAHGILPASTGDTLFERQKTVGVTG